MRWRKGDDGGDAPLDAAAEADLAAIDDALAGRDVPPEQGDLAELAVDLRGLRDEPDPAFLSEMDRRMADQIAATEEREQRVPWYRKPYAILAPAAGAAAAVIIAIVVATGGDDAPDQPLGVQVEEAAPRRSFDGGGAVPSAGNAAEAAPASYRVDDREVRAGEPIRVVYSVPERTTLRPTLTPSGIGQPIELERIDVQPGSGRLAVDTEGVEPGDYVLEIGGQDVDVEITDL